MRRLGIACLSLFLLGSIGTAEVLISESFDYEIGDLDGNDGGTGFSGEWTVLSEFTFEVVEMNPPMQFSVPGGGVISGGSTALRFGNDSEDELVLENETEALMREFTNSIDNDDVYLSYLYRYDEDAFIDNNDFVVWWFNDNTGPQIGLKGNGGNGDVPDDIVARVNNQFAPPQQVYVEEFDISEEEGNLGQDILIVGKLSRSDLSDDPDDYDEFSIWVNPAANESNDPHAVAEGDIDNFLAISLESIGLRAFSQEPGDAMFWDALRIGTTWEDVTSALGDVVGISGDFDGSGVLDEADIDALTAEVQAGGGNADFDLNGDGSVDQTDRTIWVQEKRVTWFGDANLDGEFNSSDFVVVFQTGEYEDAIDGNSSWADGDWNGDGNFDSSDFVSAFQGGGFEIGPRVATSAVPEPTTTLPLLIFGVACVCRLRGSQK